jgi:hypothetical protein
MALGEGKRQANYIPKLFFLNLIKDAILRTKK